MKYKRLILTNFKSLYGETQIDFSTSETKPITILFGLNGSGKTAVVGAMYWALFGLDNTNKIAADPNLTVHLGEGKDKYRGLLNTQKFIEVMETGDKAICSAEVHFEHKNAEYRVTRTLEARRNNLGEVKITEKSDSPSLVKIINGEPGEPFHGSALVKQEIERVCASSLAPFIYHSSENLNNPFSGLSKDSDKLRDAIYSVVGQDALSVIEYQSNSTFDIFKTRVNDLEEGLEELRENVSEKEEVEAAIKKAQEEVDGLTEEIGILEGEITTLENLLREHDLLKPLMKKVDDAKREVAIAEADLREKNSQVQRYSKGIWMIQAETIVADFSAWFSAHRSHFPLKINQNLILHMEKTGICVCGKPITKAEIKAVKDQVDAENDESAAYLTHLYNQGSDFATEAEEIRKNFQRVRANAAFAEENLSAEETALAEAESAVSDFRAQNPALAVQLEDIEGVDANWEAKNREAAELRGKRDRIIEADLVRLNDRLTELENAIAGAAPTDLKVAHARKRLAQDFHQMIGKLKNAHALATKGQFEDLMNKHYKVMKADRKIRIDNDFKLKTVQVMGDKEFEIGGSGAETSLIRFAFAAALTELIPAYHALGGADVINPDLGQQVETLPLVVDAPFSNFGDEYFTAIAKALPQMTNQLIICNAAPAHVMPKFDAMKERIGKAYAIKVYGAPDVDVELSPDSATFTFNSQEHNYWDMDYEGLSYSEVKSIEV